MTKFFEQVVGKEIKDDEDGIDITESSNGIDASDQLVLRFSSVINIEPEVYRFKNHHMITFGFDRLIPVKPFRLLWP